jgi:hypothetical protein
LLTATNALAVHALVETQRAMMKKATYLHADEVPGAVEAAGRIVPAILEVTGAIRSVVDLGGGSGAWLKEFQKLGIGDVLLADRPEVESTLLIDRSFFEPIDLNVCFPAPRRFDLAVSVECAEHLEPRRARPLVEWLAAAADRVVFSAAIPGQGGKGHRNEQPPEYWQDLFLESGFVRRDVLRPRIVHDLAIPPWYRQNIFLFTKAEVRLATDDREFLPADFCLVHRDTFERLRHPGVRWAARQLASALISAARDRLWRGNSEVGRRTSRTAPPERSASASREPARS